MDSSSGGTLTIVDGDPAGGTARTPSPPRADARPALSWRVIHDIARPGARNMALDHALATSLEPGRAVLRLYSWERPTVSFGRNEPARGLYSVDRARALSVDYVRRPTGGRAVLHDEELTYAVVVPVRSMGGARATYRRVNEALAGAMRALGAPVDLAEGGETQGLDAGPCFRAPVEGEVVVAGRKLIGSAQARIGGALLQHGSIILGGDQRLLDDLSGRAGSHEPPASLRDFVPGVTSIEVASAVRSSMESVFAGDWRRDRDHGEQESDAERLESERYGTDEWTWRL